MSWVRAAAELQPQGEDEIFDEEADEMKLLQNDWKQSMEKRLKVSDRLPSHPVPCTHQGSCSCLTHGNHIPRSAEYALCGRRTSRGADGQLIALSILAFTSLQFRS